MSLVRSDVGADPFKGDLDLLVKIDPTGTAYLQIHHVPITPLHFNQFHEFVPDKTVYGFTPDGAPTGIFLDIDRLTAPEYQAETISHELVHVQHNDPSSHIQEAWFLIRQLVYPEEAEARVHELRTAIYLHRSFLPVWQIAIAIFPMPAYDLLFLGAIYGLMPALKLFLPTRRP